jgi:hypothetical protein
MNGFYFNKKNRQDLQDYEDFFISGFQKKPEIILLILLILSKNNFQIGSIPFLLVYQRINGQFIVSLTHYLAFFLQQP